jgi:hypothetical protein
MDAESDRQSYCSAKNRLKIDFFLSGNNLSETLYFHIDNNQRRSIVAVDYSCSLKKNMKEIEILFFQKN